MQGEEYKRESRVEALYIGHLVYALLVTSVSIITMKTIVDVHNDDDDDNDQNNNYVVVLVVAVVVARLHIRFVNLDLKVLSNLEIVRL